MASKIPKKLKHDSIVEALCEVQFRCHELPEIVIGRLGDCEAWKSFRADRLPVADIPESLRANDPNLKFQPTLELKSEDGTRRVRIGSNVISFHRSGFGSYCGWNMFEAELRDMYTYLFEKLTDVNVTRIGFRYVNALTVNKHLVPSVNDLDVVISAGGSPIGGPVNLNYIILNDETHATMTRIAAPDFVQGSVPIETAVVVDIDVTTPKEFRITAVEDVVEWTRVAHEWEKKAFFSLIPDAILNQIVEEW